MESIALWQGLTLCGIVSWIFISSCLNVTQKLRNLVQPWVSHHVITGTPIILQIQVSINFHRHKKNPFFVLNSVCEVFFLFSLFFSHFRCFFPLPLSPFAFVCRNTSMDFWMLYSLDCPVLFLCLSTLLFFLCSSGYALFLFV